MNYNSLVYHLVEKQFKPCFHEASNPSTILLIKFLASDVAALIIFIGSFFLYYL